MNAGNTEAQADPVHKDAQGWWFYDETWVDRYGPFASREAADEAMAKYACEILGVHDWVDSVEGDDVVGKHCSLCKTPKHED